MSDDFKLPDISGLMEAAQKLQGNVSKMHEELAKHECEASSGGGMVTAVVNGHFEVVALTIDKEVVDPDDISMLQDLVVAAINQATDKMREKTKEEMAKITGGLNLNIPGLSIP